MMDDDLLKESLQELYEQAPCGYLFTRPDGTIVRVNQTFLDWTGYARDDLSATRFQDLLTVPGQIFYENQFAPLLRLQGFVNEVAFDLVRQDRDPLPVLMNSVQRTDADGRPVAGRQHVFDATDRRRVRAGAAAARAGARSSWRPCVTASSDAILSALPRVQVQTWNAGAERLFGYSARRDRRAEPADILCPAEATRLGAESWPSCARGAPSTSRRRPARRRAGASTSRSASRRTWACWASWRISAIIRDISERRALERLQQEFLAMAATSCGTRSPPSRATPSSCSGAERYNERAVERSSPRRTAGAADRRPAAGVPDRGRPPRTRRRRPTWSPRPASRPRHWARRRPAISRRGPGRAARRCGPTASASARCFANLLTNAVKYSPDGSEIVVRVGRKEGEARVAVVDQGVGIPPEALPHLFDRFYRAAGAAGRVQGLGLGLYITRRIVEAHGGHQVESEPGAAAPSRWCSHCGVVGSDESRPSAHSRRRSTGGSSLFTPAPELGPLPLLPLAQLNTASA